MRRVLREHPVRAQARRARVLKRPHRGLSLRSPRAVPHHVLVESWERTHHNTTYGAFVLGHPRARSAFGMLGAQTGSDHDAGRVMTAKRKRTKKAKRKPAVKTGAAESKRAQRPRVTALAPAPRSVAPGHTPERWRVRPIPDVSGAHSDDELIDLWLDSHRSVHTREAYARDVACFRAAVPSSLSRVSLMDVQTFAKSLRVSVASQKRVLSSLKSLLSYGHRTGYLQWNVGAALKLPALKTTLAERILPEDAVQRLIHLAPSDRALLKVLYNGGLRVEEACTLKWRDITQRESAAQVNVFGKGGKTRVVLLTEHTWLELQKLRNDSTQPNEPVFRSRKKGGHLCRSAVLRIVRKAAVRANVTEPVSPHWLRHAHASHALDRGAPIHLVQATLGHASVATTGLYLHAKPAESSARFLVG